MTPLAEPIAITGTGIACNLGADVASVAAHVRAGKPGRFVPIELAVQQGARCTIAGLYPGDLSDEALNIDRKASRFMGRASRLALAACVPALKAADVPSEGLAVLFASGAGDIDTHIDIADRLARTGSMRRVPPTVIPKIMSSTVSANLASFTGATGPSASIAAACAGGSWNIAIAAGLLMTGHARAVLAGGVEVWDPHFHAGFDRMRAYNGDDNDRPEQASRPYAADRRGFVMGEGAGAVVLERWTDAIKRGADIQAVILGWGLSSDGQGEMVAPDAGGAARAMRQAIAHAGIRADAVDYINTHATSTPAGDVTEARAIREVMGGRPVRYSSTKGYTGHTITGAGAIEAVLTVEMLRQGWVAPSVNAAPLDPELADYPPVLEPTDARISVALSNSFGFGGTNAVLALGAG